VPTCEEVASIADSVDRAARANDLLWRKPQHPRDLRELRADALRAAIDEGRDRSELAARLGVRDSDLDWMTSRDEPAWPPRLQRD
jgi:hypothetical protein